MKKALLLFFLSITATYGQILGCTDPLSKNYNSRATENDGSCLYKSTKIKPEYSNKLSDSIKETSGIIAFNSLLWTHNDDHDKTIYGLNPQGEIKKKIILEKAINTDWEEIAQDSTHIYLGDFGNNYIGNRTDLHILKIDKKSFLTGNPVIDTISFSYANQTRFTPEKPNKTNFDCEAFIVRNDSIYLFTKQWKHNKTSIYTLPNKSGNHVAQLKETIDVKGLITGVTYLPTQKLIVLCGYSKIGKPFLFLLYDYKNNDFLAGNKRRIKIALPFHQVEGIATEDGLHYYLTNESLIRKPVLNVPQQIHQIDLSPFLSTYLAQYSKK
ncbi:T9SS C-terminal target domain-containing protein [Flavobacterium sp. F-65]|uniref:T9SS C-terminal target domain-containing protein n=1 Tax=Flavobacterium pisciphilum TaxID=2893755 RepID=A0ABS8MXS5_9FLAO|nr:T9SS C-terminal target domain-containing protein [Flavobacterium sp. F-65]MCC9073582.1 T9SS C-terminal target domain-containing protein [Flavobacterium sp. F-65]